MNSFRWCMLFSLLALSSNSIQAALVAHYSFDSDYSDSSGNGNHGVLTDVGTQGNTFISTTNKVFGSGAISFSDDRDYVGIPQQTFTIGQTWSVAFWAKRNSATRQYDIVAGDKDDADNFLTFFYGNSPDDVTTANLQYVRFESNEAASDNSRRDFVFNAGTDWHHYAFVSDGSTMTVYADGVVLAGTKPAATDTSFLLDAIGVGYLASLESDMQGLVDEFYLFNHALSASEVASLQSLNAIPEPGFMAMVGGGVAGLIALRRRRS